MRTFLAGLALLGLGSPALTAPDPGTGPRTDPRADSETAPAQEAVARPGGVAKLLFARPFHLDEPYRHTWRAEQPLVHSGYLLVLEVDEGLARPRQTAEPVLFAGRQTLERINTGRGSGRLVVVLPSAWSTEQGFEVDLAETAFWFGTPALPERVDAAHIAKEAQLALELGVGAFEPEAVKQALARGGLALELRDSGELRRAAAGRILEFAPAEEELARSILVPLVRPR